MDFDPDAFLAANTGTAPPQQPEFNPDSFLASFNATAAPQTAAAAPASFDPDAFLASVAPAAAAAGISARGQAYGPVVGETHHDAMFGPNGNPLGPHDVALSPDYQRYFPLGSQVYANGKGPYTVADSSYRSPGQPNQATIEFRDTANPPKNVTLTPTPTPVEGEPLPLPDEPPGTAQAAKLGEPDTSAEDALNAIATQPLAKASQGERPPMAMQVAKFIDNFANSVTGGASGADTLQNLVSAGTYDAAPGEPSFTNAGIPTVPQQEGQAAQIAAGAANVPIGVANFLLSPGGINSLAAGGMLPKLAQTLVGAGFTAQQAKEFISAPNTQARVQSGIGTALMGFGTAASALAAKQAGAAQQAMLGTQETTPASRALAQTAQAAKLTPKGPLTGQPLANLELPQRPQTVLAQPKAGTTAQLPLTDIFGSEPPPPARPVVLPQPDSLGQQILPPSAISEPLESADMSLTDKIKRVADEAGLNKPPEHPLNFKNPGMVRGLLKSWAAKLNGVREFAKNLSRYRSGKEVRQNIAATWDYINNGAAYTAGKAESNVRLNLPVQTRLADEAATFVRQAAGDRAGMAAKLNAIRGAGFDDVIDYALKNWDKLEAAAEAARENTDAVYKAEQAAGIDFGYRENYVKGAYEDDLIPNLKSVSGQRGAGSGNLAHAKSKAFNDYAEAIAAGWKPKDLRLSKLTQSAVLNGMKLVNRQVWAEGLGNFEMPDGNPAIKPMERVPARNSAGETTYRLQTPQGYVTADLTPGNAVAVHPDAAGVVKALTSDWQFPALLSKASSTIKHNILAFDIYHGSRFAQMQMAFEGRPYASYHKGLAVLEYSDADLAKAVKNGEISQKEANWAQTKRPIVEGLQRSGLNTGQISDALWRQATPIIPGAKATGNFIFQKLSRGVITQSGVYAFERNARLHPDWSTEKNMFYSAREVNTYYRNLGHQGIFKSPFAMDAARFLAFAPQWFEGKVTSEGRGYGQMAKVAAGRGSPGNIAKGMGTGLAAYFAANQLINMATRGTPTWDNPELGHKLDAWVPDVIQGSPGYFVSPESVFAEMTGDVVKNLARGVAPSAVPWELAKSQMGIAGQAFRDLVIGQDFYGKPLPGLDDKLKQATTDVAPIPLGLKNQGYKGGQQRALMGMAGIKATMAGTKVSNIYKMVDQWKQANHIKIPAQESEPSEYLPLRRALTDNDIPTAQGEYAKLRAQNFSQEKIAHAVRMNAVRSFTGSIAKENAFKRTLDPGQLGIYNAAKQEKKMMLQRFLAMPKQ